MALRSTVQTTNTTRSDYGTRFPTAKSFYDKVKPRAALGSLNNAKLTKEHPEKAMKSKVPVLRPVKMVAAPPEDMDVATKVMKSKVPVLRPVKMVAAPPEDMDVATKAMKSKVPVLRPVKMVAAPPEDMDVATKAMKSKVPVLKPVKMVEHVPAPPEDMDVATVTQQLSDMLHIKDIDLADADNPQLCTEYAKDIFLYMRELERKFHVSPTYLRSQTQLNSKMRAILVDWLVQVHLKFTLLQETLYLTVSIVDRYLSTHQVAKANLQLVGVTAMLLASKYEEMYAPEVRDFVYITDETYTGAAILKLEMKMLKELDYSLGNPLPIHFLRRYSRAGETTPEIHTMAKFLIELCLPSYPMLDFYPSLLAAGALYLAMCLCGSGEWTPSLVFYSTYCEEQLIPCVKQMARIVVAMPTSKQQAIRKKYSDVKFLEVAKSESLKGTTVRTLAS
ncbi:G2/mitotic-specific cyclin-B-like [Halichondria panicea]|uniref:G2/mitotic-specific cyclin-B-like n=1 Tax=Halichondria panicea TaxID=6063 RepID=UPI00312B34AA